jgi:pimeloyl-ACP methyl ester carboxylesterase
MRRSVLAVVALLFALPGGAGAQTFTPVPCPVQQWEFADPSLAALPGAKAFSGRYDGGLYQVEIPDNWNGELVLYAHGAVRNSGPTGSRLRVETPLLRRHLIGRGFAWAASSYRCNGSIYGIGLLDTMALSGVVARVGPGRTPARTYLVGQSLGGRAALLGMRFFPERFAGALAMCAVGQETNDLRAAIRAAAEAITGVAVDSANLSAGIAEMTKVTGPAANLTDKGRQLASVEIESSGGPRPFAVEGLANRLLANVQDGALMTPDYIIRASTTRGFDYRIDRSLGLSRVDLIARIRPKDPEGDLRTSNSPFPELRPFDGQLTKPVLAIAGTGDLQVPVAQQRAFRQAVTNAGKGNLLVQRLMRIPGHCQFSEAEQSQAFDDLVNWVRTGARPEGDDVMGDLRDAGRRFTNPLRPGDPGRVAITVGTRTLTAQ